MCNIHTLSVVLLVTVCWITIDGSRLLRNRYNRLLQDQEEAIGGEAEGPEENCLFNICEDDPAYPEREIVESMRLLKPMDSYFGNLHGIEDEVDGEYYESRLGHMDDDEVLCQVRAKTFQPRSMLNTAQQKRFLINVQTPEGKAYTMKLKSEICHVEAKCSPVYFNTNSSVERRCVQKFGEIRLLSFDKDSSKVLYDLFPYPTTCVCKEFTV